MAANAPLTSPGGPPVPLPGEFFRLTQNDVEFSVESGNGYPGSSSNYSGLGTLFLSDQRLVYVRDPAVDPDNTCDSFVLPLRSLSNINLNQPLWGCNNITGEVLPIPDGGLLGTGQFRLAFKEGGIGVFVRVLVEAVKAARAPPVAQTAAALGLQNQAFFDPDNPMEVILPAVTASPPQVSVGGLRQRTQLETAPRPGDAIN
eukprot:gnl/Hemi2/24123_TR8097_c0_g1_i1.p1 gnl/Hemi2/24123_TR8097_c0_g1~~gnl/Hemi2/24123_TR8097_c0_g1_i1.p1  ORF type:complete len:202 (-),score=26.17 gnl/Hemi2/24123_TR8097_c0_g1_i1:54-659(-)